MTLFSRFMLAALFLFASSLANAKLPLTLPKVTIAEKAMANVTVKPNYYTTSVNLYNGAATAYMATVMQQAPMINLPSPLSFGGIVLSKGVLTLSIPSTIKPGSVTLTGTYTTESNTTPTPINMVLGTWKLNQ